MMSRDSVRAAQLRFGILMHRADALVVSHSSLQHWSCVVGRHGALSSCASSHQGKQLWRDTGERLDAA
jgi:hypothetical protein